jgi:hypothetical protein
MSCLPSSSPVVTSRLRSLRSRRASLLDASAAGAACTPRRQSELPSAAARALDRLTVASARAGCAHAASARAGRPAAAGARLVVCTAAHCRSQRGPSVLRRPAERRPSVLEVVACGRGRRCVYCRAALALLSSSTGVTVCSACRPNRAFERTGHRRCRWLPSARRASASAQRERYVS